MMSMQRYFNRTRRSRSIPAKLLRQGRIVELPLYYLLRLSDLAREGFDHSGSYRFADHIYRNVPSGRGWLGRRLDAWLLEMRAVRSFRNRFLGARDALCEFLTSVQTASGRDVSYSHRPVDVLSVPCGIPRELVEGARLFRERAGRGGQGADTQVRPYEVRFHGLDLDDEVLAKAEEFARAGGLPNFTPHHGDALDRASYPEGADFITCTGLAEFLDDAQLERLYGIFFDVLRPGGVLVTSGMQPTRFSEYLLRLAELETHYRSAQELEAIARRVPFSEVRARTDELGLQAILTAPK